MFFFTNEALVIRDALISQHADAILQKANSLYNEYQQILTNFSNEISSIQLLNTTTLDSLPLEEAHAQIITLSKTYMDSIATLKKTRISIDLKSFEFLQKIKQQHIEFQNCWHELIQNLDKIAFLNIDSNLRYSFMLPVYNKKEAINERFIWIYQEIISLANEMTPESPMKDIKIAHQLLQQQANRRIQDASGEELRELGKKNCILM